MRPNDVAALAGVAPGAVSAATANEVHRALTGRFPAIVLAVATHEPAWYWRVGDAYYLDDPFFGPVVAFTDLVYDDDLGLSVK